MTLTPFPYFGGKASLLNEITARIPAHTHYIEPFGGSGAVILNKEPSAIETYNDLDGEVVSFFRVLRSSPEELADQILLTPYSRTEFQEAKVVWGDSEIERARKFYIRIRQGFNASSRSTCGWRREVKASRGTPCSRSWRNTVPVLAMVAERLGGVQIENMDAFTLIKDCDSPDAFFYLDPPYMLKTRKYKKAYAHEMSDSAHFELLELVKRLKGKVLLSGYDSELYANELRSWYRDEIQIKANSCKKMRTEVLWANYPMHVSYQLPLEMGLANCES